MLKDPRRRDRWHQQEVETFMVTDLARIRRHLLTGSILSALAIGGAVSLGAVAAITSSTGVMWAAIAGATILGGAGMAKAFGVGIESAATALIAAQPTEQGVTRSRSGLAECVEPHRPAVERTVSKVDALLTDRAQQSPFRGTYRS